MPVKKKAGAGSKRKGTKKKASTGTTRKGKGKGKKKGASTKKKVPPAVPDPMSYDAMLNAYYISHGPVQFLQYRGYKSTGSSSKKKKKGGGKKKKK